MLVKDGDFNQVSCYTRAKEQCVHDAVAFSQGSIFKNKIIINNQQKKEFEV